MQPTIETSRLILRPFTKNDAKLLFSLDSIPEVHKYLGNTPVKTIAESEAMLNDILHQYKVNSIGRLAVINKATKEFMGWSGLKLEDKLREAFNYYDLGYRFIPKFWGKGYATESAIASLKYGFKDLKLNEICAAADWDNLASNHVLKKIGMHPDGDFTYDNTLCNWYTMTEKQWRSLYDNDSF